MSTPMYKGDDDDNELSTREQQIEDDLSVALAKQGLTRDDFPDGVDYGTFLDMDSYDWDLAKATFCTAV